MKLQILALSKALLVGQSRRGASNPLRTGPRLGSNVILTRRGNSSPNLEAAHR
jgi:hypothetical protein